MDTLALVSIVPFAYASHNRVRVEFTNFWPAWNSESNRHVLMLSTNFPLVLQTPAVTLHASVQYPQNCSTSNWDC
jgi:hypothetical protein